jgi:hypothetical protein
MGKDAAAIRGEFQARLEQFARELSHELYPDGLPEGVSFADLEDLACAVGDEISREVIEAQIRRHAEVSAERPPELCPACGEPLQSGWLQDRRLTTTRGPVTWTEKTAYCPRCRRAFSPSEPSPGARWHKP